MVTQTSIGIGVQVNADGFELEGGTTRRNISITGGDIDMVGGGAAVITFPTSTSTLATLALTETLTNKTITLGSNTITGTKAQFDTSVTDGNFLYVGDVVGVTDSDKGDITVTSTGTVWTVDNNVVTFAKIQDITTDRLIGRDTAATGDPEEISVSNGIEFSASLGIWTSHLRNAQTGTTYTIVTGDRSKYITLNNAAAVAVTLPVASATFPNGWYAYVQNIGAGTVTITPTTSTINGGTTLVLTQNQSAIISSDGTNYSAFLGTSAGGGSGTVTATGGSLTSNSVVLGAGTTDTKVVAGITTDGISQLNLGVNTTTLGKVKMFGNTSGDATIQPAAVAGTATVLTLPAVTGTLATLAGTETLTNKTLTSPILTAPTLGSAGATAIGIGKTASASIRLEVKADATFTQGIRVEADSTSRLGFSGYVTGDSNVRFTQGVGGLMEWGSGAAVGDTNLYRTAADTLKTDDNFIVGTPSSTAGSVVTVDGTQTVTSKTMTGATNTLTASLLKSATTEVSVSAATAPSVGQVLTATSTTTATWQAPTGGTNTYFNTVYTDQSGGTSDTYGVLAGTINGSNALFTVSQAIYATGTLRVYLNGQLQIQGSGQDWVETTPASGTFTFAIAPATGSEITAEYQKVTTNSSTVVATRGIAEVDFGSTEQPNAIVTVSLASISTTSYPSISVYALATTDHDPEDYLLEGVTAYITNIVNGVGFDIIAGCNDTTWGKYKVTYQF